MKNLMIVESIIIGLLVGVATSTYLLYMSTVGRGIGYVFDLVSLGPVLRMTQYGNSIIASFLFYVLVFLMYVILINLLIKINKKIKISIILLIILLLGIIIFDQNKAFKTQPENELSFDQINFPSKNNDIKKYFGEHESFGNLNDDNRDDVAFIVKIEDKKNEVTDFYLSVALKDSQGYSAKNLLYIDEDIQVESIKIEDKKIILSYKIDDESFEFKAEIVDGELKESVIEEVSENTEE